VTGRIGRTPDRGDEGFTLIELLTVMVVLGVLTAIAIPVFLGQREKAHDTATQSDLVEVAKLVTAEFLEHGVPPTVQIVGADYEVNGQVVGPVSQGVAIGGGNPAVVDTTGWTAPAWCMTFTSPTGGVRDYRYSAQQGLEPGACTSPITP
jgi:prepilin-type N-terminal cleavage/methylation domain-containing protein